MSELRQAFLDGMSCVAATVNVVTTDGPAGRAGITVSAMSSVSADTEKPVLLVCVNDLSAGAAPIIENGVFTVNILRDDQSFVSDTFAGRYGDKGEEKFACAEWDAGITGAPVLRGALASFDCRLMKDEVVGQHHVFFGEVQQVHLAERGRALIYANRSYSTALSLPPTSGAAATEGAERIALACLSSFAPLYLPSLMLRLRERQPQLRVDVIEGDQAQVAHLVQSGEAALGLMYDAQIPEILEYDLLTEQQPYALFMAGDPRAGTVNVSLRDLASEPLILLDQPLSRDYLADLYTAIGCEPNIALRPSSIEMVRSLVGQGIGYSVLVTRPAGDLSYDGKALVTRPIAEPTRPLGVALVRHRASPGTKARDVLARECADYFNTRD